MIGSPGGRFGCGGGVRLRRRCWPAGGAARGFPVVRRHLPTMSHPLCPAAFTQWLAAPVRCTCLRPDGLASSVRHVRHAEGPSVIGDATHVDVRGRRLMAPFAPARERRPAWDGMGRVRRRAATAVGVRLAVAAARGAAIWWPASFSAVENADTTAPPFP